MSKILRWKCDECGKVIPDGEGSIHIRELKQDISFDKFKEAVLCNNSSAKMGPAAPKYMP